MRASRSWCRKEINHQQNKAQLTSLSDMDADSLTHGFGYRVFFSQKGFVSKHTVRWGTPQAQILEPYRAEGQPANPGDSGRFVDWLVISIEIGIRPKPTRLRPCSLCTFLVETVPTSRLVIQKEAIQRLRHRVHSLDHQLRRTIGWMNSGHDPKHLNLSHLRHYYI